MISFDLDSSLTVQALQVYIKFMYTGQLNLRVGG